jgi:hypothetical protein
MKYSDKCGACRPRCSYTEYNNREQGATSTHSLRNTQVCHCSHPAPPSVNPELLRLYVGASSLRIEGFPNQSEKKVRLPCEVNRVGIRSTFKDEILEIRMVKKRFYDEERQINITIQ